MLKLFWDGLLQLLYPGQCWACGQFDIAAVKPFCDSCLLDLTRDPHPSCPRCAGTVGPFVNLEGGCTHCRDLSFSFDHVLRMGPYEGRLRETILRMKQADGESLAECVGEVWAATMAPRIKEIAPDVVIPIPLHWTRRWRRGFNQSEVLAHSIARLLGRPCQPHWIRRHKRTPRQTVQNSPAARRDNVHGVFQASKGAKVHGQTVLLVDDVLTTGATASEAARVLKPFRPKSIVVAVLAGGR